MTHPLLRPANKLIAEGWTRQQLRKSVADGEMQRLTRGIYTPVPEQPITPRERHLLRAAAMLATHRDDVVLSHVSAAIAHGLPVRVDDPPRVHLTTPPPGRGKRTPHHHVHCAALEAHDVAEVGPLRVTSLARTLIDVARTSPYIWGVIAADRALAMGLSQQECDHVLAESSGRAGIATARQVLAFADAHAESAAESASRVTIARAGLPAPELQFVIEHQGRFIARTDFAWPQWNLVGEMDGAVKYQAPVDDLSSTPQHVMTAQNQRQEAIRQAGFWVTRWGWSEAFDVEALGARVRSGLKIGGWQG